MGATIWLESARTKRTIICLWNATTRNNAFARNNNDVGCIENLELEIQQKDNKPVQKNYMYISIPKPLYGEVKEYLEDMINQNWNCKSCSAYSSPMVCICKKDGSLRLCIDYQELNKKTYPEQQMIPRIQDILNGLGSNKWFFFFFFIIFYLFSYLYITSQCY